MFETLPTVESLVRVHEHDRAIDSGALESVGALLWLRVAIDVTGAVLKSS